MKRNFAAYGLLLGAMGLTAGAGQMLARVEKGDGAASGWPLPVYALGQGTDGGEYALAKATAEELAASGRNYRVLDEDAEGAEYILAWEFRKGARDAARERFDVLHEEGRRLLIRTDAAAEDVEVLGNLGFQCRRLPETPLDFELAKKRGHAAPRLAPVASNATVSAMIAKVEQTNLYAAMSELTGVVPVMADGTFAAIATRHQSSGLPLQRATALAYERFEAAGLQAGYQAWTNGEWTGRNVVGTKAGRGANAQEIVVVCAHIDDMPSGAVAPGADDNASGCVAVMAAAEIMENHAFDRTIRFVIFTGEEQGLLGSEKYAQTAHAAGDNIVGVLNLDMIGWDGNQDRAFNLYVRPAVSGDRAVAATFTNVVGTYGITNVVPAIIEERVDWSDHAPFWDRGYAAACGIEEDVADFNPYYHTTNDTLARINMAFFTGCARAVVGTAAHLAGPMSWDDGYEDLGGGWRRLGWFGDYASMGSEGWIWHNKHGFMYPTAASTRADIWFYTQDMGWLWTGNATYPFLYRSSDGAWLWYNGATGPRWFRNMTTGQWESRP